MARKTAAEKAAEEQAAAEAAAAASRADRQRLMWAGAFLAAVALFAAGYVVGDAGDDDTIVGSDTAVASQTDVPVPGVPPAPMPGRDRGPNQSGVPGPGIGPHTPGQTPRGQYSPGDRVPGFDQAPGDETPVLEPGYLGISVRQTPDGVAVVEVIAGAPGDDAGIAVDDLIVAVDGIDVVTVRQFARHIRISGSGAEVQITLVRDGIESTVTALLVEIPA